MPGIARVVCDGFVAGEPFDACPRQVLRARWRGWRNAAGRCAPASSPSSSCCAAAQTGFEPADPHDRLDKPSYDLKSLPRQREFLRQLADGADALRARCACRSTTKTRTASTS
jgi:glutamine synthetase